MSRFAFLILAVGVVASAKGSPDLVPTPPPGVWAKQFEVTQTDPVGHALKESKISGEDSLQVRINKLLYLLNHNNYLDTFIPPKRTGGSERFLDLPREAQANIQEFYKKGDYELDSLRSPEEMLKYRCGGFCGTHALSFAQLLLASGIKSDRIRIVSAVNNEDLKQICPGDRGMHRSLKHQGAAGHVFVMVQLIPGDEQSWTLINTTQDPLSPDSRGRYRGNHQNMVSELVNRPDHGSHDYPSAENVLKSLDSSDLEMSTRGDFPFSPRTLAKSVAEKPTAIPRAIIQSSKYLKPMTIFSVDSLESYPRHSYEERLNLVASGDRTGKICRYDCRKVPGSPGLCSNDCENKFR